MKGLSIPTRPSIILSLQAELGAEEPNLGRIKQEVSKDVALAGAVIRAVNSPAFGLSRKMTSINQAIDILGLKNLTNLATAIVLRQKLSAGNNQSLERFWDSAEKVAQLCAFLASRLRGISPDEAYSYGLFHDCGIAVLMHRFANYRDVLKEANVAADQRFTAVEDRSVGTNHAVVGYFLARSWSLQLSVCEAILIHHELDAFSGEAKDDSACLNFIAIGHLAAHFHHLMRRTTTDVEWVKLEPFILGHFGLDAEDCVNLFDEAEAHVLVE
jgi:HD-like signal output (HDOD) protein